MRTVLILCVIISAALTCPIENPSCSGVPKICPSEWNIKKFESQYATLAFQGKWFVQMTTPTLISGSNPLKTGLFCSCYPSTLNELIFTDNTPCDDTDFNTEYHVIDQSFNVYSQTIESTRLLFSPAYGKDSKYALFNVGSEKYYQSPIPEKYPFIDDDLIRHKIEGFCEREYTVAVIGADDHWEEYMVLAVINQYANFFCGNDYIIFVLTRELVPKYSTYCKAFEDIERSGLTTRYLISVDHSYDQIASSLSPTGSLIPTGSSIPSISSGTSIPSVPGDIDSVIQQTSTSTQSVTKSVDIDNNCGSSYSSSSTTSTTTVKTSTVIIDISPDFTSPFKIGPCSLYKGIQIYKDLDFKTVREAMSGLYYMSQGTPCSFGPDGRVGMLNTAFPASACQFIIDDSCKSDWDINARYMFMDRGLNLKDGKVQETRGYIMSAYSADHEFSSSVFALYHEGYYTHKVDELNPLDLNGMICKQPSDIYKYQIIISIIGYCKDEYLILCIANQFKNPFFNYDDEPLYNLYCYTRKRIPSQKTLDSMNQELLRSGYDPNKLVKMDQTEDIISAEPFYKYFGDTII